MANSVKASEVTVTLTRDEYLHLAKILQLLGIGIQLYITGNDVQPDQYVVQRISKKMFFAFMDAEDEAKKKAGGGG